MSNSAYIEYISYYLPEQVEHNADLEQVFPGKADSAVIRNIGVSSRHVAERTLKSSDLGMRAALKLFDEYQVDRSTIDALVFCSLNHDYLTPATSCLIQNELGLSKNVAAFDINHGCSGYIYCLALAKSMINTLGIKNMLIITATHASSYIHPRDVAMRLLFGDAGAATLVCAGDKDTIGEFVLGTDGSGFSKLIVRDGWEANPINAGSFKEKQDQFGNVYTDSCIHMDGPATFFFIIKHVPRIIDETLAKNHLTRDDIDLYVLHQANYMALEKVREKLGINTERFFYSMDTTGNTVQSTLPIALKDAMQAGKIKPGSVVLIAGFGIGLSWGATVIRF